ncbi:MAG TPA: sialidase family protein [Noviherbaspirillum sp.]|uniref:sialidase family protein n=1 Tax=Noviherbaspirillum sp. TaxID=1926288 RepID=UPI002D46D1B2|nr:sialidase family protein [Noviherbaspirillum sp.]HYD96284.1 sialidase family protein [Noviherbaspirillum sp.]
MDPRFPYSAMRLAAILFAFSSQVSLAVAQVAWNGSIEIAAGRGEKGPWQQNDSRYDYVDDPAVAIDARGATVVAWVDQARKDVLVRRYNADGSAAGAAVNLSRNPATFSWLPRIAFAPRDPRQVFILWQEIIFSGGSHGGEMFFARSEDGGATFSEPVNLSNSVNGDGKGRIRKDYWHNGSYDLAIGDDGTVYAAWTEFDGPLWFSRSTDGGKRFSPPQRIAGEGLPARAPALAAGRDRRVFLAWTTGEDNGADIHLARSDDAGANFGQPRIVAPSKSYSDAPKIALDANGVLHLAYAESEGGPFERYRVRYARSSDGGQVFEPARDLSPPPGKGSAAFPSLAVDAAGTVFVSWELYPDRRDRPRGLGMTVSRDGGRSFSAPQTVPGSADPAGGGNGSHQGLLMEKLAVNDTGEVVLVNSSLKQNAGSRVWLLRGRLVP